MTREDYIITEKNGRFGLSLKDGTVIAECVYDEIRLMDDKFQCRLYRHIDAIRISDGSRYSYIRDGWVRKDNIEPDGKIEYAITPDVLKWYDKIEENIDGFTIVYQQGKFGINAPDGHQILPCEYDELEKWSETNVIATRKGNDYQYFDTEANEILTERPINAPKDDFPYYADGGSKVVYHVKELVNEKIDNMTFESNVGYVRLHTMTLLERAEEIFTPCSIIPMPVQAKKNFLDEYSYDYCGFIGIFDVNSPVSDWIKAMYSLHAFEESDYFIEKFSTNSQTRIRLDQFVDIKRHFQDQCECLGKSPYIGYTIDESLKDGQVKWEHDEHYLEHPLQGSDRIDLVAEDGTLEELKEAVEKDWDADNPYGMGFFYLRNIHYRKDCSWEDTKKMMEYIAQYDKDYDSLLSRSISLLRFWQEKSEEVEFYSKTLLFALEKGANPNYAAFGTFPIDELQEIVTSLHEAGKTENIKILREALDSLRSYGGMTKQELRDLQDKEIAQLPPDAYDYLKEI